MENQMSVTNKLLTRTCSQYNHNKYCERSHYNRKFKLSAFHIGLRIIISQTHWLAHVLTHTSKANQNKGYINVTSLEEKLLKASKI